MEKKNKRIYAWEIDENDDPTGEIRYFIADSLRTVIRQIAYEFGGDCGTQGLICRLPDKKKWAASYY